MTELTGKTAKTEKTRTGSIFSSARWKAWLPKHSVVMARKSVVLPESESTSLRSLPAVFSLVVVTDSWSIHDAQARPLLDRMIQAMGLSRDEVSILATDEPELLKLIKDSGAKAVVVLGASAASKVIPEIHEIPVMPVADLKTLLENPSTKKDAWASLQKVMAILTKAPPSS